MGEVPITLEDWLTFLETLTCKKEYHSICMKLGKDGENHSCDGKEVVGGLQSGYAENGTMPDKPSNVQLENQT